MAPSAAKRNVNNKQDTLLGHNFMKLTAVYTVLQ